MRCGARWQQDLNLLFACAILQLQSHGALLGQVIDDTEGFTSQFLVCTPQLYYNARRTNQVRYFWKAESLFNHPALYQH